jgi:hypothetical protein
MAGKKVVPAEIMEAKIRATMAERLDAETLICVRTDARAVLGFDEALRRAERYINAGAEAIFVEAPESIEELERVARSFDVPQFANPLVGGRTPILSPKEFEQLGFNAICFGLETIMHAAKAMENRARGHARGHLRAARPGHGVRGIQNAGPLRPLGPHRQSLWSPRKSAADGCRIAFVVTAHLSGPLGITPLRLPDTLHAIDWKVSS